ncbi:hypothetical protein ACFQGE_00225 [Halomicroarcula sp. GCM10025817]|uniref:hypothetical protein n=1 Tax=Halomicroarcula sp. GCM10025817 TaxID=3252672 RepID=UPI003623F213
MPLIRGYYFYGRYDPANHLGYITNILTLGSITEYNIYPGIHIVTSIVALLTDVPPRILLSVIPPIYFLIYTLAAGLIIRYSFDFKSLTYATPLLIIPIFRDATIKLAPSIQGFMFAIFIFYIYSKFFNTNDFRYIVILITSVFAIVFYHPIAGLGIGFMIFLYVTVHQRDNQLTSFGAQTSYLILLLLGVIFLTWYSAFPIIGSHFVRVLASLLPSSFINFPTQGTSVDQYKSFFGVLPINYILQNAILRYGQIAILGVISVLSVIGLILRKRLNPVYIFFVIIFILSSFAAAVSMITDIIIGFGRISKYVIFSGTILSVWKIRDLNRRNKTQIALCVVTLILIFSLINLYSSPFTSSPNQQVAKNEQAIAEWTLEFRNQDMLINELGFTQEKLLTTMGGRIGSSLPDSVRRKEQGVIPPPHFNYTKQNHLSQSYTTSQYLIITRLGRYYDRKMHPKYEFYWDYTPEDFNRLQSDPSVSKIYTNGESTNYLIR